MIAVSGALVLVAIALLVTGLALPSLVFVYASIGMSLVSAGCLVVGVFAGRGRLFRRGSPAAVGAARAEGGSAPARSGAAGAAEVAGDRRSAPDRRGPAAATGLAEPPADAEVVVLPGRPRYHLASCRLVKGRATETLVLAEAREERYVACTACRPDAALAARGGRDEEPVPGPASEEMAGDAGWLEDHEAADEDELGTVEPVSANPSPDPAEQHVAESAAVSEVGERPESSEVGERSAAAEPTGLFEVVERSDAAERSDASEVSEQSEAAEVTLVSGQRRYHRPGCAVVADAVADGAAASTLAPAEAEERGLTPCTACHPG